MTNIYKDVTEKTALLVYLFQTPSVPVLFGSQTLLFGILFNTMELRPKRCRSN